MYHIRAAVFVFTATFFVSNVFAGKITLKLKDSKTAVTHLYLDFDHTVTVDGFSGIVRGIFCKDVKYPGCNCTRLPGGLCNGTDETSANEMVTSLKTLPNNGVGNLTESFGGQDRLDKVRSWLTRIRKTLNGNVYLVSTSWFPVTGLQWQRYLVEVSNMLNLGFDTAHVKTLADLGPGISSDKGAVIKKNMEENNVPFAAALFADDSGGNIESAKDVCNTVYLSEKKGVDQTDRDYIETLIGGCCAWSVPASSALQVTMSTIFMLAMVTFVVIFQQKVMIA